MPTALVLALVLLVAPFGDEGPTGPRIAAAAVNGRLLLPRNQNLEVLDLASGAEAPIYASQQMMLGAAWAPDGERVAFSAYGRSPGDRFGGADLFILDADQVTTVATHASPDQVLNAPVWTPDGGSLIYAVAGTTAQGSELEQLLLDGSEPQELERSAAWPAVSPDGSLLAFVRVASADALMVRPLSGGSPRTLAGEAFLSISAPRFSPDGQQVAFFGIGGPTGAQHGEPQEPSAAPRLGVAVAEAHGVPWDPWVVNLDGSGLRQVASLAADDPNLAWSPDGSTLAVLGGDGLRLVSLDGSQTPTTISSGSYGALDWRP